MLLLLVVSAAAAAAAAAAGGGGGGGTPPPPPPLPPPPQCHHPPHHPRHRPQVMGHSQHSHPPHPHQPPHRRLHRPQSRRVQPLRHLVQQQHVWAKANGNGQRGARRLAAAEGGPRTGKNAADAHLRRKRLGEGSGGRRRLCPRRRRHRRRRRRASPRGWRGPPPLRATPAAPAPSAAAAVAAATTTTTRLLGAHASPASVRAAYACADDLVGLATSAAAAAGAALRLAASVNVLPLSPELTAVSGNRWSCGLGGHQTGGIEAQVCHEFRAVSAPAKLVLPDKLRKAERGRAVVCGSAHLPSSLFGVNGGRARPAAPAAAVGRRRPAPDAVLWRLRWAVGAGARTRTRAVRV
ncbi:hypothetical protein I4F81_009625 [Pyropia yezoensis]|uniref:Uncharacterized protein n=1 Tax=Pyropia yezoensis TaxID=2788 RepID=A0ACC3CAX5_PYRYE|nr:hypothetical protein I4F81_009625 [Neopyropia yezoensis]